MNHLIYYFLSFSSNLYYSSIQYFHYSPFNKLPFLTQIISSLFLESEGNELGIGKFLDY